jgi:hypothetical protein
MRNLSLAVEHRDRSQAFPSIAAGRYSGSHARGSGRCCHQLKEIHMRMRIILVAFVLAFGIVGITAAQQPGDQSNRQNGDRAKLRAQVVKLRVEIDLLELDHDADKSDLLELIKGIRMSESMSPEALQEAAVAGLFLRDQNAVGKLLEKEDEKGMQRLLDESVKKTAVEMKALRDRKRKDYAKQAAELAEKRLELEELEKRYNQAK